MATPTAVLLCVLLLALTPDAECNNPPLFTSDMNGLVLNESVPVGTVVYRLQGFDPENSPVRFHIRGTDKLQVDEDTGEVKLVKPLNYEEATELKAEVLLEDEVNSPSPDNNVHGDGDDNNVVNVDVSVIITDVNDNMPIFINGPYEVSVPEDIARGTTIFKDVRVIDPDTVGEDLEVTCSAKSVPENTCDVFSIVPVSSNVSAYHGVIVLNHHLDFAKRSSYQMILLATDGAMESRVELFIRVVDVQNSPPVFTTSMVAVVMEDAEIGSKVMTVHAIDGDKGKPRDIQYELVNNPMDYFLLDTRSGDLTVAKQLDKEAVSDPIGILTFSIRAYEVENGVRVGDAESMKTEQVTVTIQDVNDEPPRFNQREFSVEIPENLPVDTPLPRLDMTVSDPDVGSHSAFTLRLADGNDMFAVAPTRAVGATSVSIRVANTSLDYENPNQRKFIIRVIAEEESTKERHSSTATVTVMVTDTNDNSPIFSKPDYSASVNEAASPGTYITTITATDRDSGRYGTDSIIYRIEGIHAERFNVDKKSGAITVAECETPGLVPCLDLETKSEYHLTYTAADNEGIGMSAQVPLRITLTDANDNPPRMAHARYRTSVEEGARELQPPLIIAATDADNLTEIEYHIIGGNELKLFDLDPHSGQITIRGPVLDLTNLNTTVVTLYVEASDGRFADNATVSITIQDVNNNAPEFTQSVYLASIKEDSTLGTFITQVEAHDGDTGENAQIRYQIQSGGFNDFNLNNLTGTLTLSSQLDYDRRSRYGIIVLAIDGGVPPHTGTTTVQVTVINSNDKAPSFNPVTQRTNVTESAAVGAVIYKLQAHDPDANNGSLNYEVIEPISAISARGHTVLDHRVKEWFKVDSVTGDVFVAKPLQREVAAVVTLSVIVTDNSAPNLQQGRGLLVVTIIDVNDHAPMFASPWSLENPRIHLYPHEGWSESPFFTFSASDEDSSIAYYAIIPPSDTFTIENTTGVVRLKKALDYEKEPMVYFTVWAFDTGVPQLSSSALVIVNVTNDNDNDPVFLETVYQAEVVEDAPAGTYVTTVAAKDLDVGAKGQIYYSLVGNHAEHFSIGTRSGEIKVLNSTILDREVREKLSLEVVATDGGEAEFRRAATVRVEISLLDINDNAPVFASPMYEATVMENIPLSPPIVQTHADDPDFGENGTVSYAIVQGNSNDSFRIDKMSGIIYPAKSLRGGARIFSLVVEAKDGGLRSAQCNVRISILDVNENRPVFIAPKAGNATILVPENAAKGDFLIMVVKANDSDAGKNGHVSYHFQVNNTNVQQTNEFVIDEESGELRTRFSLDREVDAKYEVVLVAKDHGTRSYETLQLLTILLQDDNDNVPEFSVQVYQFSIMENNEIGIEIGQVRAIDRDEGIHARVYYSIIAGNDDGAFRLDRLSGKLYANTSLDRETQEVHSLYVKAGNDPDSYPLASKKRDVDRDPSHVRVKITVLDENDNPPKFEHKNYYVGVKSVSVLGELLTQVRAEDPDLGVNGTLEYLVQASNLFKSGSLVSSGSVIPSPFSVTKEGKITTAAVMSEYTQDRFQLTISARELAFPNNADQATVHVWVYENNQLIRVVLSRPPEEVNRESREIVAELSNATKSLVVIDDIRYHVDAQKHIHRDWTDMYLHVVDTRTQNIINTIDILKTIDAQYDFLKDRYLGFAIERILPAVEEAKDEAFDTALAALVALLIVLFVGCVTFLVVCCCLRSWVLALPGKDSLKKKDVLIKQAIIDEMNSTTDNPLWMEQKLKLYEEQELTMQVFIDEIKNGDDNISQHEDNTYATIQHSHHGNADEMGDYETLTQHRHDRGGGDSGRSRSQSTQLGFHGSTFQPPLC